MFTIIITTNKNDASKIIGVVRQLAQEYGCHVIGVNGKNDAFNSTINFSVDGTESQVEKLQEKIRTMGMGI